MKKLELIVIYKTCTRHFRRKMLIKDTWKAHKDASCHESSINKFQKLKPITTIELI